MTCVHFLLTKARDKNVYSLKLIREKSSRLSTETDHRLCTKKEKKIAMDTYRRHYCPEGKLEFGLLKTESEVANDQLKEIFNVSLFRNSTEILSGNYLFEKYVYLYK